jgi:hypothetical protein
MLLEKDRVRRIESEPLLWRPAFEDIRPQLEIRGLVDLDKIARIVRGQDVQSIAVTLVSQEYIRIGICWARSMQRLGIEGYLVIACDEQTGAICEHLDIPYARAFIPPPQGSDNYVSPHGFSRTGLAITALKFPIAYYILSLGRRVHLSDADAIWLKNPDPFIPPEADIAFQRVVYFPGEIVALWEFAACTGYVVFSPTKNVIAFVHQCIAEHQVVHSDQLAMNLALLEANAKWEHVPRRRPNSSLVGDRKALFAANVALPIYGQIPKSGARLLALPHHQFWRHTWLETNIDDVVICHPNSRKYDTAKIELFKTLRVFEKLGIQPPL